MSISLTFALANGIFKSGVITSDKSFQLPSIGSIRIRCCESAVDLAMSKGEHSSHTGGDVQSVEANSVLCS